MNNIVVALLPYIAVTLALAASATLFLMLNAEMRRMKNKHQEDRKEFARIEAELIETIKQLRRETEAAIRQTREEFSPTLPSPKPSLNLNRRTQVLRLAKRGERPEQIAAALGIPQNEVQLLLKLHESTHAA